MNTMVEVSVGSLVALGFIGGCAFVGLLVLACKAFFAAMNAGETDQLRYENARLKGLVMVGA